MSQPSPRAEIQNDTASNASEPTLDVSSINDTHLRSGDPGLASTVEFAPRSVIGPYQLINKLGQGGMGAVYQARHLKLEKLVALKILSPHLVGDAAAVQRFEREMKAVGKLEHPNIVRAMDAGEVEGTHFLVMEYVEGVDLHRLVKNGGPQPLGAACRLIRQAALALAYAHERGLVHRDIKPSNLFLTNAGQLKVLDLGLAKLGPSGVDSLTNTGASMGTPDYMSPEQWTDMRLVDHRSDLYALGCTLYFLLLGRPPFGDDQHSTVASKMNGHISGEAPLLRATLPDIPREIEAVYKQLLAKQRNARPSSGHELADALAPFADADDQPISPRRFRAASWRPMSGNRKTWFGIALATTTVVMIVGCAFFFFFKNRRQPVAQRPGQTPAQQAAAPSTVRDPASKQSTPPTNIREDNDTAPNNTELEIPEPEDNGSATGLPNRRNLPPGESSSQQGFSRTPRQRTGSDFVGGPGSKTGSQLPSHGGIAQVRLDTSSGSIRRGDEVQLPVLAEFVGHSGPIRATSFSRSQRYLATASDDQTIRIWDLKLWKPVGCLRGYSASVRCVAFSPNDELVAWSGAGFFTMPVMVWNLRQNKLEAAFEFTEETSPSQVNSLAFSSDGKLLAAAGSGPVHVWSIAQKKLLHRLNWQVSFPSYAYGVAFSPDNMLLAAGCHGGDGIDTPECVRTWKVPSGDPVDRFSGDSNVTALSHDDVRGAVSFSADGTTLYRITKGSDRFGSLRAGGALGGAGFGGPDEYGSLLSWSLKDQNPSPQQVPTGGLFALAVLPKGKLLVAATTGGNQRRFGMPPGDAASPTDQVDLWDASDERTVVVESKHRKAVTALGFAPEGDWLATGGDDNRVKLWDVKSILSSAEE